MQDTRAATVALLLGLALAIRVAAALGGLYNDEIWSLEITRTMTSVWEAISRIHHDNNHILNTMLIYWIGIESPGFLYRTFSLITGSASVGLLGYASLRRGYREAILTLYLAGFSYPLVLYASEARGYAPAIFFAVAAFLLLQSYWEDRKTWKLGGLWISIALGFLSHLTFFFVYVSLGLWSVARELRTRSSNRAALLELAKCHALPTFFLLALYTFQVRHIRIGGGAEYGVLEVVRRAILLAAGASDVGAFEAFLLVVVGGASAWAIFSFRGDANRVWIFFVSVLLAVPGVVLAVRQPDYLYFRYLLICFPFFYLVLSRFLNSIYQSGQPGRIVTVILLALYAAGNLPHISDLISLGRGQYREAVLYMADETRRSRIVIGSDHDFRNALVLSYYARYLPAGQRFDYRKRGQWPAEGLDWLLTHSQELSHEPLARISDRSGNLYRFDRSFPYAGVSGWNWYLYRGPGNSARENTLHSRSESAVGS